VQCESQDFGSRRFRLQDGSVPISPIVLLQDNALLVTAAIQAELVNNARTREHVES